MKCLKCYSAIEDFFGTRFESYASLVCRYPWWFIIIPLVVNGLLGIGLMNLKSDNDVERLYTPRNSQASEDRIKIRSLFGDTSGTNFYSQSEIEPGIYGDVIFQSKQRFSVLNLQAFNEIKIIYERTTSITFTDYSGLQSNFSSLCARRGNSCVIDGDILFTSWFQSHLIANTIPYPGTGANSIDGIFGDIQVSGGILRNATYIKLRFHLRHDSKTKKDDGDKWMAAFLSAMKNIQTNHTNMFYAHSKSLDEELNSNIGGDIVYFALTFTLMIIYATSATANFKCVTDRQNLGRAGVLAAAFAILGAFGIVSACGLEFVSIVGTMPFLIIGIGVDDMFLLLSGLAETYDDKGCCTPLDRIKRTMRSSGVGITITSLTDLLAFLIGATSTFNSVRNFCVYTGVAVLFCYLNYVTFFLGCMYIHEKRVHDGLHCCTCKKINTTDEKIYDNCLQDQPKRCMCTGSLPKTKEDVEGPFEKYPPKLIARFVLLRPVKVIILVGFAAYLAVTIWGATQFQQGLVINNLVADDSYYYRFSQINEEHFASSFPISLNIQTSLQYSDDQTWNMIQKLQSSVQSVNGIDATRSLNWLTEFRHSTSFDNSSETNFITALRSRFLPAMTHFQNDVAFGNTNTTITASRFYVFSDNVFDSSKQGSLMQNVRNTASAALISNVIAYAPSFIFFEQYVAILPNTLQTLGISIAAIFVVTAIFLPHPVLVVFVTITLTTILVGLFGFMHFWNLTLSSITMIHIIMSVGFSVDFSAHICHGFMEAGKSDRNEGAKAAVIRSGGPIYNGALSSIVGIIMLLFSKSFIFKSFFKVMLLIILLGASHALLVLPVILSFFGPKFDTEKSKDKPAVEIQKQLDFDNKAFTSDNQSVEVLEKRKEPKPLKPQQKQLDASLAASHLETSRTSKQNYNKVDDSDVNKEGRPLPVLPDIYKKI